MRESDGYLWYQHWAQMHFSAALTTHDIVTFTTTAGELGYSLADLAARIRAGGGSEFGLDMDSLCELDAVAVIATLELWDFLTARHVSEIIIPLAPHLRAALRQREHRLTRADLTSQYIYGLPDYIVAFLPHDVEPDFITKINNDGASRSLMLALLQQWSRPLSWEQLYRLLMARAVQHNNLLNCILPVERFHEPTLRAQVTYLDERWGCRPGPDGTAIELPAELMAQSNDYDRLYRLFLVYFLTRGGEPRVPFHRYGGSYFVHNDTAVRRHLVRPHTYELTFTGQVCGRLLLLLPSCNETEQNLTTSTFISQDLLHVYIPPQSEIVITVESADIHALYDYDVGDFAWLAAAFVARDYDVCA